MEVVSCPRRVLRLHANRLHHLVRERVASLRRGKPTAPTLTVSVDGLE